MDPWILNLDMPGIEYDSSSSNHKGALLGKYEMGKLLGCGAFAKVYSARNLESGESVAIKVMNKKMMMRSNVKREVSIMRRLHRHPHIVKLLEVLATKSKIYFVLELVKGGELFAKAARGRFSEDLSRHYFRQLISAVRYCHSRGVFHRDLKPENLLLDHNGNLKVSDFGLSAQGQDQDQDQLLLLHTLCGTPAYVAPEILAKKGYHGAKVDVWSCGIILFVLNAGFLPFNHPNLMVMYKKIYKGDFRCPKWMSSDLKRLLSRLLDTNPRTRITVDQILRDPWFTKGAGCEEEQRHCNEVDPDDEINTNRNTPLNAFDIISFSSGLDLSGLFDNESCNSADEQGKERFLSSETPETIMHKIEGLAKAESLRVKKKEEEELGFHLEGAKGEFQIGIEVYRLTQNLVVVEVKKRSGDLGAFNQTWKNKLRPQLRGDLEFPNQLGSLSRSRSSLGRSSV